MLPEPIRAVLVTYWPLATKVNDWRDANNESWVGIAVAAKIFFFVKYLFKFACSIILPWNLNIKHDRAE